MRASSLLSSSAGIASTHFKPIDMGSTCDSRIWSFSGERKSDNSGKKLKTGSSMLPINPRSIAIPSASEATLFETHFKSCSVSTSKVTFLTGRFLDLVGTLEFSLEHQLAAACDQNGVHVGARSREPVGHPAQRLAIDALIIIGGGDGPAVVPCDRNAATAGAGPLISVTP